jgi:hypothetical protein
MSGIEATESKIEMAIELRLAKVESLCIEVEESGLDELVRRELARIIMEGLRELFG